MTTCVSRALLALALGVGLVGCAGQREPEAPKQTRMDEILDPSGASPGQADTKYSRYNNQQYRSKSFGTKNYQTTKATVGKRFKAPTREFNAKPYQTQEYGKQVSPLAGRASPYADDKARTKAFTEAGKVAPTNTFSGSDKEYATERASDEGRRFKSAKIKRQNVVALRAQERKLQASDFALAKLPMGAAGPGAISKVDGTGRMRVQPRMLAPEDESPGATLSTEEVRGILNKGPRAD